VIKVLEHIAIRLLKMVQKHINQEYEKNGLSDDMLDLQIRLNQLVNKYNVNFNEEWKQ
jgi:hypothetical protein